MDEHRTPQNQKWMNIELPPVRQKMNPNRINLWTELRGEKLPPQRMPCRMSSMHTLNEPECNETSEYIVHFFSFQLPNLLFTVLCVVVSNLAWQKYGIGFI